MKAWRCSRCRTSPKDGGELIRWFARGFLRFEIERHERAVVNFQPSDIDSLICRGCITAADGGTYRTLHEITEGLLMRLEDPTPRSY